MTPGYNHDVISDVKVVSGSLEPFRSVQVQLLRKDDPRPNGIYVSVDDASFESADE
jgi:hypothetical protein